MACNFRTDFRNSYQATAGANKIIKASKGFLHAIVVGKSVAGSVIEVSDHASDGNGNVKVYLAGDALLGVYIIDSNFDAGISADLTNATNVTFIYE